MPGPAAGVRPAALQAAQGLERCFNPLKQCCSVATRYDKTVTSYQATVTIAALLQWS